MVAAYDPDLARVLVYDIIDVVHVSSFGRGIRPP